jgi:hypothetical protein
MHATQTLPDSYRKKGTMDISKNEGVMLLLNLIGLVVMVIFGYLFFRAIFWLNPTTGVHALQQIQSITGIGWLGVAGVVILLTVFHIILHEAIHGVFFWVFTGSRPRFAFRWTYAYASAPDWFIPRNPFLVTTLAPFVLISLGGLAILGTAPSGWLLPTWLVMTMNAGGAVGDMAVAIWLVRQPSTCLAQDRGDSVTLFVPE